METVRKYDEGTQDMDPIRSRRASNLFSRLFNKMRKINEAKRPEFIRSIDYTNYGIDKDKTLDAIASYLRLNQDLIGLEEI